MSIRPKLLCLIKTGEKLPAPDRQTDFFFSFNQQGAGASLNCRQTRAQACRACPSNYNIKMMIQLSSLEVFTLIV
jgi:hypothetical protein